MKRIIFFSLTIMMLSLIMTGCKKNKKSTSDNLINSSDETEYDKKENTDENIKNDTIKNIDIDDTQSKTGESTQDSKENKTVKQILYESKEAGYTGQELLRVDFKARTHAQVSDIIEYYSSMEEKGLFTYSSFIPAELSQLIIKAMDEKTEEATFEPLKTGIHISREEFSAMTGVVPEDYEGVVALKADADNDGIDDIVGLYYYGGTGGFAAMQFYKGLPDGKYTLTSSFECMSQAFDIISYQDKLYLLMEEFDYNTKHYSGYSLYLYEYGKPADGKLFSFAIDDYDMDIEYEDSSFEDIVTVKNTLCNPKLRDILENNDWVITGTAEAMNNLNSQLAYIGDIDNDNIKEQYDKYMWLPSNMGTVMHCMYYFEDSLVLDDLCEKLSEEVGDGVLYAFWIDEVNGKNILYLYFGKNLDFSLYGFYITKAN